MAEFSLTASMPDDGADQAFDGVAMGVVMNRAVVSVAVPRGGNAALTETLQTSFGLAVPSIGSSASTADAGARLLRLRPEQFFLLIDGEDEKAKAIAVERLGQTAYVTDQSDSWIMLIISGAQCRTALARLCPVDLHPSVFPVGKVARTVMEHFGVIILHEGPGQYLLMSANSSAASFRHAIETALRCT